MQALIRIRTAALGLFAAALCGLSQQPPPVAKHARPWPPKESFNYTVEWRLIHAGNARLDWIERSGSLGWQANLQLESVGLVSRLYKVNNLYSTLFDNNLCAQSSLLKTDEGSKHRETSVTYNAVRKKISYLERDLNKNRAIVASHEVEVPGCVFDVVSALYQLRSMKLEPGQSAQFPITDGKKFVMAKAEAQEREKLKIGDVNYQTIRYEAFLFNDVLYRRKGRLFVWLTDDDKRLPVQIRIRLPILIGTVTFQLNTKEPGTRSAAVAAGEDSGKAAGDAAGTFR